MTCLAPGISPKAAAAEDSALAQIAAFATTEAGLALRPEKYPMLRARLGKRMRSLGIADLSVYCRLLDSPEGVGERTALIGALTTHVSHFFREPHHFDRLRNQILPPLLMAARAGQRVRLWSAGCAAGQEAWTLAMILTDLLPDAARHDILVLATDIDPSMIAQAATGRYPKTVRAVIPDPYRTAFTRIEGPSMVVSPALAPLVRFRCQNLHGTWRMGAVFDVILCRNVLIYFETAAREALLTRFAQILTPGGMLMLGHAERASGPAAGLLAPLGQTIWRRRGAAT